MKKILGSGLRTRTLRACLALAFALIWAGPTRADPEGTKPAGRAVKIFSAPRCDVEEAMSRLAVRIGNQPRPVHNGIGPWPDLLGHWQNAERDVYITIYAQAQNNSRFMVLNVELRSVCDDRILAHGAKVITKADSGRDALTVRLRNYDLEIKDPLLAIIRLPQPDSDKNKMEIKLQSLVIPTGGQAKILDRFYGWKF